MRSVARRHPPVRRRTKLAAIIDRKLLGEPAGALVGCTWHAPGPLALGLLRTTCPKCGIAPQSGVPRSGLRSLPPPLSVTDLQARLLELPKEILTDLLVQLAEYDERVRERVLLLASTASVQGDQPTSNDVESLERAIRRAIEIEGYIDYRGASLYARQVEAALEVIEGVLASPHRCQALRLVETAIEAISTSLNNVDDSGEINEALEQLRSLHHRACEVARLAPEALAQKLFDAELGDNWCLFGDVRERYAEVLGGEGCEEFDRLVGDAWAAVPMLGPNERPPDRGHQRERLRGMMQRLVGNQVDERIEIIKKDLSAPSAFAQIALLCTGAGQTDRAVTWVEKGLTVFPRRDAKLVTLARELYSRLGRSEDLARLAFNDFVELLDIASYRRLKDTCGPGAACPWQQKAQSHVEERLNQSLKVRTRNRWPKFADGTLLVQMLLDDGEAARARDAAKRYGCADALAARLPEE